MEANEFSTQEQKLTSLKKEASQLEKEIESGTFHSMDKVLHVCSVAFQFGQVGEIWDSFVSEETLRSLGQEVGKNVYPPLIKAALGKKLIEEIKKGDENRFSVDSIKKIAAISSMMGDMDKRHTIEDR